MQKTSQKTPSHANTHGDTKGSNDNECVICLEREISIDFPYCKHKCVCYPCLLKIQEGNSLCPLCRKKIYVVYPIKFEQVVHFQFGTSPTNQDFFDFLKSYFKLLKPYQSPTNVIQSIYDQYDQICKDSIAPPMLSVDQVEILLKICLDKQFDNFPRWKIFYKNLLTALCIVPWKVDRALAGHGICYYGNFGESPTLKDAIRLLLRNHNQISTRAIRIR